MIGPVRCINSGFGMGDVLCVQSDVVVEDDLTLAAPPPPTPPVFVSEAAVVEDRVDFLSSMLSVLALAKEGVLGMTRLMP